MQVINLHQAVQGRSQNYSPDSLFIKRVVKYCYNSPFNAAVHHGGSSNAKQRILKKRVNK